MNLESIKKELENSGTQRADIDHRDESFWIEQCLWLVELVKDRDAEIKAWKAKWVVMTSETIQPDDVAKLEREYINEREVLKARIKQLEDLATAAADIALKIRTKGYLD